MTVDIRLATPADVPFIAGLRESVGWGVRRWVLDAFTPPVGAAWVAVEEGAVVGCGSGIVHGRIGIVGNMVVAESHRRRGIGAAMLETVLRFLQERADTIELNATSDGRPLYERFGFEPVVPYRSATIPARHGGTPSGVAVALAGDPVSLADWDAERFGGSRLPILAAAVADPERHVIVASAESQLRGYAVVRPGEACIGPWVVDDAEAAGALLACSGQLAPAVDGWRIVLPGDNDVALRWLAARAPTESHGMQMRIGPPPERRVETIWGTGAGAVG